MNSNDRRFFASLANDVQSRLGLLESWQRENSHVADYRVSDALTALRTASRALTLLVRNEHGPQWHAAMAAFRDSLSESEVSA